MKAPIRKARTATKAPPVTSAPTLARPEKSPPPPLPDAAPRPQVDKLKAMMADPARKWVWQKTSAEDYLSGIRLFAYRGAKGQLDCRELARGIDETRAAEQALDSAIAKQASSAAAPEAGGHLVRVRELARQTRAELMVESGKRCRGRKTR